MYLANHIDKFILINNILGQLHSSTNAKISYAALTHPPQHMTPRYSRWKNNRKYVRQRKRRSLPNGSKRKQQFSKIGCKCKTVTSSSWV